jgi:uncharacterized protein DUF2019
VRKKDMRYSTSEELIKRYKELAIIHGELRTAKEANRAYVEKKRIWDELDQRGSTAIEMFLQLLDSSNPIVRLAAAGDALFVAPEKAERVLEQLTREPRTDFTAFTASVTLQEWRAGRLRPFFLKRDP